MATNIRLPEDLGPSGFVRIVRQIGEGQLALTFLAHVVFEGAVRRAYIKFYDASTQPMAFLNEILGSLFAQSMGIPSPKAFTVDVPAGELYRYGYTGTATALKAFGSLEAHDPNSASEGTAKTFYVAGVLSIPQVRERLLKSPAGRALLGFDEAVGNADRNIGNIVFSKNEPPRVLRRLFSLRDRAV